MIHIINKRTSSPIGMPFPVHRGYALGNPYYWGESKIAKFHCKDRAEAIKQYEIWLRQKIEEKDVEVCAELNKIYKAAKIGEVSLLCFCNFESGKEDCHARIVRDFVQEKLQKQCQIQNTK